MKRCGLLGKNISYSKSPVLHNNYYMEKEVQLNYELFDIKEEELPRFIQNLRNENILGFNVTIPYKETIIKYLDKLVYPANKIQAVNTVLVKQDSLIGFNTDYYGFKKSIEERNISLKNKNALVLGGGGSAKCISYALLELECNSIDIAVRNKDKIDKYFKSNYDILLLNSHNDLDKYDIIVNCTPLGGINYLGLSPISLDDIRPNCLVYDLVYNPEKTKFLTEAEINGASIINGENMLKNQAYKAADIWIDYLLHKI